MNAINNSSVVILSIIMAFITGITTRNVNHRSTNVDVPSMISNATNINNTNTNFNKTQIPNLKDSQAGADLRGIVSFIKELNNDITYYVFGEQSSANTAQQSRMRVTINPRTIATVMLAIMAIMILLLLVGSAFGAALENNSFVADMDNFTNMRTFRTLHAEKFETQFKRFIKKNALLLSLSSIVFFFIFISALYYLCTKKPDKNKLLQNFDNV